MNDKMLRQFILNERQIKSCEEFFKLETLNWRGEQSGQDVVDVIDTYLIYGSANNIANCLRSRFTHSQECRNLSSQENRIIINFIGSYRDTSLWSSDNSFIIKPVYLASSYDPNYGLDWHFVNDAGETIVEEEIYGFITIHFIPAQLEE